jgi:hypothetical protein
MEQPGAPEAGAARNRLEMAVLLELRRRALQDIRSPSSMLTVTMVLEYDAGHIPLPGLTCMTRAGYLV